MLNVAEYTSVPAPGSSSSPGDASTSHSTNGPFGALYARADDSREGHDGGIPVCAGPST